MPGLQGKGKGASERINIRLDRETMHFYRVRAHQHGVSVSEYLRQTLVQGVIAENVQEIEERLRRVVAEINAAGAAGSTVQVPDDLLLAVFASEAMLAAIVEARDVQALYDAQERARAKLKRLKGV